MDHQAVKRPADAQSGFAIVAVLLLLAVMLSVGASYLRHTSLKAPSSPAFEGAVEAREAVESGLEYARQSVQGDEHLIGATLKLGDKSVLLDTADASEANRRFEMRSTDSTGLGSTMLAEIGQLHTGGDLQVTHPDELPRLKLDKALSVLADVTVPKLVIDGDKTIEDTTLKGLVILEDGAQLTLRSVVVEGAVVSRGVLEEGPLGDIDWSAAPTLIVDRDFRIEPGDFLEDIAVLLPDGVFRTWYDEGSFQVRGDVSAHTVLMQRPGVFDGALAYVDLTLGADVERIGLGLHPRPLASDLTPGLGREDAFLAVLPRVQTADDLRPIIDYWKPDDDEDGKP